MDTLLKEAESAHEIPSFFDTPCFPVRSTDALCGLLRHINNLVSQQSALPQPGTS